MAQASSDYNKNRGSKILLDCPFKMEPSLKLVGVVGTKIISETVQKKFTIKNGEEYIEYCSMLC